MLHPLIRVLALLLLAAALPSLPLLELSALAVLLAALLAFPRFNGLPKLAGGVLRLRWLLLAIVVLYWGFTPGEALHPATPGLSREGVLEGTRRMLVLVDLLAAVHLLLAATPIQELTAALAWLAQPLRLLGWEPERFARRMGLVLQQIGAAEEMLRAARGSAADTLLQTAANAVQQVERRAAQGQGAPAALVVLAAPPVWQWLLLPALAWILHWAGQ